MIKIEKAEETPREADRSVLYREAGLMHPKLAMSVRWILASFGLFVTMETGTGIHLSYYFDNVGVKWISSVSALTLSRQNGRWGSLVIC